MRQFSIVSRINIALACIVALAIGTMLVSYWLSDKTDNDAHAVNVAGSLRMQSYRLALLTLQQDEQKLQAAKVQFNQSWQHPVFTRFMHNEKIASQFETARQHWQQLEPELAQLSQQPVQIEQALTEQIQLLEQLVSYIQQDAEQKVRSFRSVVVGYCHLLVKSDGSATAGNTDSGREKSCYGRFYPPSQRGE